MAATDSQMKRRRDPPAPNPPQGSPQQVRAVGERVRRDFVRRDSSGQRSIMIPLLLIISVFNIAHQARTMFMPQSKETMAVETTDCNKGGVPIGYITNGSSLFLETALNLKPLTDKVTTHQYHIMYGDYLLPYYYAHPNMKMLEIGLGCNMEYGAGASVGIWKQLFPSADLWEAEQDSGCVEKHRDTSLKGLHVLVGDQSRPDTLKKWIADSGGGFDVIIDDGGHRNCQIWTSFQALWPEVKKGGLYFIEDMQVAKDPTYNMNSTQICNGNNINVNVPDKLKEIQDRLIYMHEGFRNRNAKSENPFDIELIVCQPEACVLRKSKA